MPFYYNDSESSGEEIYDARQRVNRAENSQYRNGHGRSPTYFTSSRSESSRSHSATDSTESRDEISDNDSDASRHYLRPQGQVGRAGGTPGRRGPDYQAFLDSLSDEDLRRILRDRQAQGFRGSSSRPQGYRAPLSSHSNYRGFQTTSPPAREYAPPTRRGSPLSDQSRSDDSLYDDLVRSSRRRDDRRQTAPVPGRRNGGHGRLRDSDMDLDPEELHQNIAQLSLADRLLEYQSSMREAACREDSDLGSDPDLDSNSDSDPESDPYW